MSSRLVVLGSCGAWPEAGRACSGYVLEHDGVRIVLDLGYATLPQLLTVLGSVVADGIDAVVVTHRHPDHAIDLHGLFRARWLGQRGAPAIPVYSPPDVLDRVIGLEDGDDVAVRQVFDWHLLPAADYQVGPFRLQSWALPHRVPNAGVRLSAPGLTVAYTGDTGPDDSLAEVGRDADLYIVEATDRGQRRSADPASGGAGIPHLSARQAGQAAAAAGARRLLLSHFWPGNDRHASRAAAAADFPGEVLVAEEGMQIALP